MRRGILFSVLLAGGAAFLPAPASAGFFDILFGRPDPAPVQSAPLEFDVRSRARAHSRPRRPRFEARRELATRNARPVAAKIDPVADPDWRLKDPTLRRGDIVVLSSGPVVFEGMPGDTHALSDFMPLATSRVATALQRDVRMMVAGRWMATKDLVEIASRERKKVRRSQMATR